MQDLERTTRRVLNPVAIAALVLAMPLYSPVGESAAFSQRGTACVTQARAEALVRCVSEAARRWCRDHVPGAAWVCPARAGVVATHASPNPGWGMGNRVLFPSRVMLELDLDLPPPAELFASAC